jgi:hypothetical protein
MGQQKEVEKIRRQMAVEKIIKQKFLRMFHGVQGGQFFQKAPPWSPKAKEV